eukprot:NODE_138_length_17968_cov_0.291175.p4 type:complete len:321 gc:universal NODE_138_length_17968_cov_0.291175:9627-8665(-)
MNNFGNYDENQQLFECLCGITLHSKNFAIFHLINLCEMVNVTDQNKFQSLLGYEVSSTNYQFEKCPPHQSLAHEFGKFTAEFKNDYFTCNCGVRFFSSRGLLCNHFNICTNLLNVQRNEYIQLLNESESKLLKSRITEDQKRSYLTPSGIAPIRIAKQKNWKIAAKRIGEFSSNKIVSDSSSVIKYLFTCGACKLVINDSKTAVVNHLTKGCQKMSKDDKINNMKNLELSEIPRNIENVATSFPSEISFNKETETKKCCDKPQNFQKYEIDLFKSYLKLKVQHAKIKNKQLEKSLDILHALRKLNSDEALDVLNNYLTSK